MQLVSAVVLVSSVLSTEVAGSLNGRAIRIPLRSRTGATSVKRAGRLDLPGAHSSPRLFSNDTTLDLNGDPKSPHVTRARGIGYERLVTATSEYYATISVGTPPVSFTVVPDTGSADFWIAGPGSRGPDGKIYDPALSITHVDTGESFGISYFDDSGQQTVGIIQEDTATLAGITMHGVAVGAATSLTNQFRGGSQSDGVLGLGLPDLSWFKKPTFMDTMNAQADEIEDESEMVIGGANPSLYQGDFKRIRILGNRYWTVPVESISMRGHDPVAISIYGMLDTGTSLILCHPDMAQHLHDSIPGAHNEGTSDLGLLEFSIPCSGDAVMSVVLDGHEFQITQSQLGVYRYDDGTGECKSGVSGMPALPPNFVVFGHVLLRTVYTKFVMRKDADTPPYVAFAQLVAPTYRMTMD